MSLLIGVHELLIGEGLSVDRDGGRRGICVDDILFGNICPVGLAHLCGKLSVFLRVRRCNAALIIRRIFGFVKCSAFKQVTGQIGQLLLDLLANLHIALPGADDTQLLQRIAALEDAVHHRLGDDAIGLRLLDSVGEDGALDVAAVDGHVVFSGNRRLLTDLRSELDVDGYSQHTGEGLIARITFGDQGLLRLRQRGAVQLRRSLVGEHVLKVGCRQHIGVTQCIHQPRSVCGRLPALAQLLSDGGSDLRHTVLQRLLGHLDGKRVHGRVGDRFSIRHRFAYLGNSVALYAQIHGGVQQSLRGEGLPGENVHLVGVGGHPRKVGRTGHQSAGQETAQHIEGEALHQILPCGILGLGGRHRCHIAVEVLIVLGQTAVNQRIEDCVSNGGETFFGRLNDSLLHETLGSLPDHLLDAAGQRRAQIGEQLLDADLLEHGLRDTGRSGGQDRLGVGKATLMGVHQGGRCRSAAEEQGACRRRDAEQGRGRDYAAVCHTHAGLVEEGQDLPRVLLVRVLRLGFLNDEIGNLAAGNICRSGVAHGAGVIVDRRLFFLADVGHVLTPHVEITDAAYEILAH